VHARRYMSVNRFEDLRVWQEAKRLSDDVGELLQNPSFQRDPKLRDQPSAACSSTALNIAEGFVRRGRKEFARHVRIAAASNAETRAALYLAHGRRQLSADLLDQLIARTESIGRMLRRLEQRIS
jgi:four helix bundle protein